MTLSITRLSLLLVLAAALAGCGFQLKGQRPLKALPITEVGLAGGVLRDEISAQLTRRRAAAVPLAQAQALLDTSGLAFEKKILSLSVGGVVTQYELSYTGTVQWSLKRAPDRPHNLRVFVRRELNYSDSARLAAEYQENNLRTELAAEVAFQIVNWMSGLDAPAPEQAPQP